MLEMVMDKEGHFVVKYNDRILGSFIGDVTIRTEEDLYKAMNDPAIFKSNAKNNLIAERTELQDLITAHKGRINTINIQLSQME